MNLTLWGISALSFASVALLTPVLIWGLRTLRLTQPIRAELPADHQAKKGTPLMAGLIFLVGVLLIAVLSPQPMTLFLCAVFFLFGFIGFLDDYKKAAFQDPRGASGKMKLVLQFLFTFALMALSTQIVPFDPEITIFGDVKLALVPAVYLLVMSLFIVGSANAINFTDGLDGLLIVVAIPTYFFFFVISDHPEVKLFALTMIACLLGLLIYNIYPAKAFMGDTGSLAIGGSLAFLAMLEKVELLVPLLFLVYFAEQLSVILQVWYFKRTKLRMFRMTPIHYHYSLKYGWTENRIVIVFGLVSWVCCLVCLGLWKLLYTG
ncbi:phospho-N-acetylmuramoyl-pentapeptide-transferase [Paenibacillus flagellatus]|uniref:Phospho-N-acetylmuramoyl-pentapeptide-transferase n=1 Tax=Paenibacillus flagellatus TaxID=2211139 RepID=A0A2V5KAC7_9BACL|nr:phospho-N-acetylmuramoyl-pentapeptide-transferase [Paenibacillus flagellatus]PYI56398.1 phospho-N-acetylmuramoyl-pentapeptide-transferase [Paenibacillus flagellatus]